MIGIPGYRPLDLLCPVAGTALTYGTLCPQLDAEEADPVTQVPAVQVPVYLAEGRRDLNAPPAPAERYLDKPTARGKHLEWFEHSRAQPQHEEQDKFNTFTTGTVLAGTSPERNDSR
jgi:pimeloyl-ACP methyl ester carboxylesterase